jgi:hypothetical protein
MFDTSDTHRMANVSKEEAAGWIVRGAIKSLSSWNPGQEIIWRSKEHKGKNIRVTTSFTIEY